MEDISEFPNEKNRKQRLKKMKRKIQQLLDNYKRCIKCIMGCQRKRKKGTKDLFETINFPKLISDIKPQIKIARTLNMKHFKLHFS